MKDLIDCIDRCVHSVGEMNPAELETAVLVLERGLIHVMVEQHLRASDGVSHLRPVSDSSH
jgi:hypothetical protein